MTSSTRPPYIHSVPPLPKMARPEDVYGLGFKEKLHLIYENQLALTEHVRQFTGWLEGRTLAAEGKAEEAVRQAQRVSLAMDAAPGLPNVEITGSILLDKIEQEQIVRAARRRDSWVKHLKRSFFGGLAVETAKGLAYLALAYAVLKLFGVHL